MLFALVVALTILINGSYDVNVTTLNTMMFVALTILINGSYDILMQRQNMIAWGRSHHPNQWQLRQGRQVGYKDLFFNSPS